MTAFGVPSHNSGQCARAATHSMSLLPWPDHQSPEKDTFADHTMEPSSNLSELHNLQINLEGQLAPQQGTLQWAAPDGLPRSSVNSCDAIPFPLDLHHNGNDISINQHHLWNDLGIASTMDELYAESCIHPPPFPSLDAAESGPSLYTTASNQLMVHKDVLDYSFQDTDDASEPDSEGGKGEPPYAKLIYDALMDAPEHQLVLRDIYTWISNNTDKAKDPAFKGWQNSVRHNLSMNGAFRKVPYADPANKHKKGYIWVLEPSAIGQGIKSTTRYRQKTVWKRGDEAVDPKRQKSGRKGGKAARESAKFRRAEKLGRRLRAKQHSPFLADSDFSVSSPLTASGASSPDVSFYDEGLPYYVNPTPPPTPYEYPSQCMYSPPEATARDAITSNCFDNNNFLDSRRVGAQGAIGTAAFI